MFSFFFLREICRSYNERKCCNGIIYFIVAYLDPIGNIYCGGRNCWRCVYCSSVWRCDRVCNSNSVYYETHSEKKKNKTESSLGLFLLRNFCSLFNERKLIIMKMTCEEMMEIIEVERHEEQLCVDKLKWMMKRTWNPIRKIKCYFDAKRFMDHVFGIDLIIRKLQKAMKES